MNSQSAAFDDDVHSKSSKFWSISARCCCKYSGGYSSMSNPYIADDRDIPFCSMCAFTLSGPQLATCNNGKGR